jgi:DNA-binding transcriptional MerR regulator
MSIQKRKTKAITKDDVLPEIPAKLYFTIGEVGELCKLKPHVLRYWEKEFQLYLRPMKRRGNRRYYKREDVELVRKIRQLLYAQGFTIEGARGQLRDMRKRTRKEVEIITTNTVEVVTKEKAIDSVVSGLEEVLGELEEA